ncbi:MAG: nitroreductase [Cupriavidus necator]
MIEDDTAGARVARVVEEVLRSRKTIRAFKPDPITKGQVQEILDVAACAPSNSNTQPWRVHVLTGMSKAALSADLVSAFRQGDLPASTHFPESLPQLYASRQDDFGARYYAVLGIDRADAAARARQSERNFIFFGAPLGLIFTIDKRLKAHSWLDLGLFVQNLMIAARSRGLDTCPQVSFARFHPVIAEHLKLDENEVTVCGMSMGYAEQDAEVNRLQMPRAQAQQFARFIGFAES